MTLAWADAQAAQGPAAYVKPKKIYVPEVSKRDMASKHIRQREAAC